MRLSLRFLIPLLLALGAFAYVAVPLADSLMQRWFVRDLDIRSSLIAARRPGAARPADRDAAPSRGSRSSSTGCCRTSASTRVGAVPRRGDRARSPPRISRARSTARRLDDNDDDGATCCRRRAGRCTSRCAAFDTEAGRRRAARARPRHELRRAAQRGDAPLPLLLLRRARRVHRAHHRRHRAALVARLGAGPARAAARRRHAASRVERRPRPSCGRSRATCAS